MDSKEADIMHSSFLDVALKLVLKVFLKRETGWYYIGLYIMCCVCLPHVNLVLGHLADFPV
jgi:hypothetical protein